MTLNNNIPNIGIINTDNIAITIKKNIKLNK
jgi:hypothetical protein